MRRTITKVPCKKFRHFSFGPSANGLVTSTDGSEPQIEVVFADYINNEDIEALREISKDPTQTLQLSQNWDVVKNSAKDVICTENDQLLGIVLDILTESNPNSFKVGELFILESLTSKCSSMTIAILNYWSNNKVKYPKSNAEFILAITFCKYLLA